MDRLIAVAGATGYVGGRVVAAEHAGHRVRCLARRPETLHARGGVHTAYYLVHSMRATKDFAALDRDAAREFGRAAREAGMRRIIYLGGLGEPSDDLSPHLGRAGPGCSLSGHCIRWTHTTLLSTFLPW